MTQSQFSPTGANQIAGIDEWRALLTLAAEPIPAQAMITGKWSAALFASEGASAAFERIASSAEPLSLAAPPTMNGITPLTGKEALAEARRRLVQFAQLRALAAIQFTLASELRRRASSTLVDETQPLIDAMREAIKAVETIGNPKARDSTTIATLGELAAAYWTGIAEQRHAAPTGLGELDKALGGGFQPGRLVVLLGGPGHGKTTLANQIAEHIANGGRPVVYLTTEDPLSTLLAKTIARIGGINYGAVLQGRKSEEVKINEALQAIASRASAQRLLYLESSGASLDVLYAISRSHFARFDAAHGGGHGLLVIDYLQRVARAQCVASGGALRDLREAVTTLTERLRDMARELNCAVLAVASQNRASGYGNANALSSAKESGDIEYTADVIMALGEDDRRTAPQRLEGRSLALVKNRLGETRSIALDWRADRQQFTEAL